jgi:tetratricopeptide (TPR) repeat protein
MGTATTGQAADTGKSAVTPPTVGAAEKAEGAATVERALALNDRGNRLMSANDPGAAELLFRQSADVFRSLGPNYEPHLATVLANLAQTFAARGDRGRAAEIYKQSLAMNLRSLGPKHIRTVTVTNYLGSAYLMLGDADRAEEMFTQAMTVARELYPKDMELASALAGLSAVRARQKRFDEALKLGEEALELCIQLEGEDSIDTALMYADIAEVHRMAGRGDRALPLFRKARATYEKILGPSAVRVGSLLSQEGLVLMDDNKLALADRAMTRALETIDKACPGCLIERWIAESNLGLLRLKQGKYHEADRLFTDALALEEKCFPTPSKEMAQTLQSLAIVREKLSRHEDAVRLNQRADMILSYQ